MNESTPILPWDTPLDSGLPANRPSRYHRATRAKLAGAPWQGSTPQSAHASLEGARAVMAKDGAAIDQATRYWQWLVAQGSHGGTDWEASQALGIQRSSINARRAQLKAQSLARTGIACIEPAGFRPGPTGIKNVVWIARRHREPGEDA
jgi:hypothetical protein